LLLLTLAVVVADYLERVLPVQAVLVVVERLALLEMVMGRVERLIQAVAAAVLQAVLIVAVLAVQAS
jgi:hypothetical protein